MFSSFSAMNANGCGQYAAECGQYALAAVCRTAGQLLVVFGLLFVLAAALWFVSQGMRGCAAGRLGMAYYWLVAPGIACHETGHALGCLLTGTKITKFVPFRPRRDGTLGYVEYLEPKGRIRKAVASLVIATGPVWFGTAVTVTIMRLAGGEGFLPDFGAYMPAGARTLGWDYVSAVGLAGLSMLRHVICCWQWRSPWTLPYAYAVFCVASEITLSGTDLKCMWKGAGIAAAVLLAVNLVPFVGSGLDAAVVAARPLLFSLQAVMAFVLTLDVAFFLIVRLLAAVFRA